MKVRFAFFFLLCFCLGAFAQGPEIFVSNKTKDLNNLSIKDVLLSMTLEEKIGQLFMVGIQDTRLSKSTQSFFQEIKPGFVVLFKKNILTPSQTLLLIQEAEAFYDSKNLIRPIFTVDQEGGDVVRIPTTPPLPTALAIGELGDASLSVELGRSVGNILRSLHIYMNLAPVLDITEYLPDSFIQTRSYGSTAMGVYTMAKGYIAGLRENRILSTAKHFPGIGYTSNDSHKSISFANLSEEELLTSLSPYQRLSSESAIDAVMMTHHIYKNIDSLPATYSKKLISILRDRLNFRGLIITDDVEMVGARVFKTPEERAVQALLSGNDVIMVAWNRRSQKRAYWGIINAVKSGLVSESRIDESVKRILTAKLKTPLFQKERSSKEDVILSLRSDLLKNTIDSVLTKKVAQEFQNIDFKVPEKKRFIVASSDKNFLSSFSKTMPSKKIFLNSTEKASSILLNKNDFLIIHVNGKTSSFVFQKISKSLAPNQYLVVNSRFRGLLDSKLSAIHVQLKHPQLGAAVARFFSKPKTRSLSGER